MSIMVQKNGQRIGKIVEIEYGVVDLPNWDFDELIGGAVLRAAMVHKALKPIFREEEQTMIKSIFDEHQDIGEARGVVIGEARGKAESGRNMVLTALRTKFRRVPKDIEKAVSAMSDPIALESLLVQAIHSETLDEFAEVLR